MSQVTSIDVFRRAREVAQALEDLREEEIWVLPPGGCTEAQIRAVGRIIDAEGEAPCAL